MQRVYRLLLSWRYMALKTKTASSAADAASKEAHHFARIDKKMKLIEKHKEGMPLTAIDKKFGQLIAVSPPSWRTRSTSKQQPLERWSPNENHNEETWASHIQDGEAAGKSMRDFIDKGHLLNLQQIQKRMRSLYQDMKRELSMLEGKCDEKSRFAPSMQIRHNMTKSVTRSSEAASAFLSAVEEYPSFISEIIEKGEYTHDQIVSISETSLFWKITPTRTYLFKNEVCSSKSMKKCITTMFGGQHVRRA